MSNNDLQQRFQSISDEIESLNLQKARAEANLETMAKEKESLRQQIIELANTNTIEEAEDKLLKLKEKLQMLSKEAEAILNASV